MYGKETTKHGHKATDKQADRQTGSQSVRRNVAFENEWGSHKNDFAKGTQIQTLLSVCFGVGEYSTLNIIFMTDHGPGGVIDNPKKIPFFIQMRK